VRAHVKLLHSPDSQSVRHVASLRSSHRDWIVRYSMESPLMWPADLHFEYMAQFNARWGYRTSISLLPSVYFPRPPVLRFHHPVYHTPHASKLWSRLLVTAVSNCEDFSGREAYLSALAREKGKGYVNLGKCHPAGEHRLTEGESIEKFVSRAFFYLAIEANLPPL
ncbi:MAG: hypothetical protein SGPRY_012408, partial [Prymnesium sp.]